LFGDTLKARRGLDWSSAGPGAEDPAGGAEPLRNLREPPPAAWRVVRYADLVADPSRILRRIADFAELAFDEQVERNLAGRLPLSSMAFSASSSLLPKTVLNHQRPRTG
jgi:hypothetical protein